MGVIIVFKPVRILSLLRNETLLVYMIQYPFGIPLFAKLCEQSGLPISLSLIVIFVGIWIMAIVINKLLYAIKQKLVSRQRFGATNL